MNEQEQESINPEGLADAVSAYVNLLERTGIDVHNNTHLVMRKICDTYGADVAQKAIHKEIKERGARK
jgi:hypothetical protein